MSDALDWNGPEWVEAVDARANRCSRRDATPLALGRSCSADNAAAARSLYCPEYDSCLDLAIARGWPGWSCERCEHFALAGELRRRETRVAAVARLPFMELPAESAPRAGGAGSDG